MPRSECQYYNGKAFNKIPALLDKFQPEEDYTKIVRFHLNLTVPLKTVCVYAACFLIAIFFLCCAKKAPEENGESKNNIQSFLNEKKTAAWKNPDFLVMPAEQPLWFQFSRGGGLKQIAFPVYSPNEDFAPWPSVPHLTGMIRCGEILAAAVNREGFYAIFPWDYEDKPLIAVKRITADSGEFTEAVSSAPFIFENNPVILLYNEDYFSGVTHPTPKKRLWSLVSGAEAAQNSTIPVFSAFPPEDGWEIKNFFVNNNALWYFSAIKQNNNMSAIHYYRTYFPQNGMNMDNIKISDGNDTGIEEISFGVSMNAAEGADFNNASPVLQAFFGVIKKSLPENACTVFVKISSPVFGGTTVFKQGDSEDTREFFGSYIEEPAPYAIAVSADGMLFRYSGTGVPENPAAPAKLPELPDGFVWTAAGFCGDTLIASWEERDNWQTGAAGFLFWKLY
jgi:hypothetical protein